MATTRKKPDPGEMCRCGHPRSDHRNRKYRDTCAHCDCYEFNPAMLDRATIEAWLERAAEALDDLAAFPVSVDSDGHADICEFSIIPDQRLRGSKFQLIRWDSTGSWTDPDVVDVEIGTYATLREAIIALVCDAVGRRMP